MARFQPKAEPINLSPLKAIRAKCLDCCGGLTAEVKRCGITGCSLWPYRDGHRPDKSIKRGNLTDWKAEHGYA